MSVNMMRFTETSVEAATHAARPVIALEDFGRLVGLVLCFIFRHGTGRFAWRRRAPEFK
jgi:hypothetical protein